MAHAVVGRINDGLVVRQHVFVIFIKIGNPPQRLWWWRNVIAIRAKDHNGRTYVAQVYAHTVGSHQLGRGKTITDKQVVDDVLHFHIIEVNIRSEERRVGQEGDS